MRLFRIGLEDGVPDGLLLNLTQRSFWSLHRAVVFIAANMGRESFSATDVHVGMTGNFMASATAGDSLAIDMLHCDYYDFIP